jgi:hypothetical protein
MTRPSAAPPRAAKAARRLPRISPAVLVASIVLAPAIAAACACGCGIFDVGGASGLMPDYSEGDYSLYFRYDYMNQNTNWRGASKAPAALNGDKDLNSSFYTEGAQWQINHDWTVMAELPVYARHLTTTDDGTVQGPAGSIYTGKIVSLGDLQLMTAYTGLSADMSTGLVAGVKLPTGDFTGPKGPLGGYEFDRDSLPGTGSTDIILGAYHNGALSEDGRVGYYVQTRADLPVAGQGGYLPGSEFDSAAGVDYNFDQVKPFKSITPVFSLLTSYRLRDSGPEADRYNSGYFRLLAAPGVQFHYRNIRLYADVEVPLYQHVNDAGSLLYNGTSGQLVASPLYKVQVNYDF